MNHEQAIREAEDKLYAIERQYRVYGEAAKQVRDDEIKALSEPIERRYREAMEQLRTTWEPRIKAARSELDALKLAAAEQGRGLADGLALGQVACEWKLGLCRGIRRATGRRGRIDFFRPGDMHPRNMADYARAAVGDYILRLVGKNGKDWKGYIHLIQNGSGAFSLPWRWYPEGVDPNKEK
jgi:hypothetical protein